MEIIEGAVVGTASEWRKVVECATYDDNGNRLDSMVAVVVTPAGWGVATVDNRIAIINGRDLFRSEIEQAIHEVVKRLSCKHEPRVVFRSGKNG
jgi:DNA mismatch repair ATPase MutL